MTLGKKRKMKLNFSKSPFPIDASFEKTLFMATPFIGAELKQIEKSHGGSLNHWVGGLMYIIVQTCYDLQYLTMRLSGYMNAPATRRNTYNHLEPNIEYIFGRKN